MVHITKQSVRHQQYMPTEVDKLENKTWLVVLILLALAIGYVHYYQPQYETQAKQKYNELTSGEIGQKPAESTTDAKNLGRPDCVLDSDCGTFQDCKTGTCYCSGGFCMLKGATLE